MAIICPLFSGSTGNSTYIGTENGAILVDAGASAKGILEQLQRLGASFSDIKGIAVTHCHDDHIKGLKTVLKRTGATLIGSEKTLEELAKKDIILPNTKVLVANTTNMDICSIGINSFTTSHDCDGSCGYSIHLPDGKKITICTDTGMITDDIRAAIDGSDAILIESNHDVDMLKRGPYPPFLKLRILSDKGHISNSVCANEVQRLFKNGTTRFILGHLSVNNNTPLLALSASEATLMDLGAKNNRDYILTVAKPKENGVTVL